MARVSDSAGILADMKTIEEIQVGDAIVGGWEPWPVVRRVILDEDHQRGRMCFDHCPDGAGWIPMGVPEVPVAVDE